MQVLGPLRLNLLTCHHYLNRIKTARKVLGDTLRAVFSFWRRCLLPIMWVQNLFLYLYKLFVFINVVICSADKGVVFSGVFLGQFLVP